MERGKPGGSGPLCNGKDHGPPACPGRRDQQYALQTGDGYASCHRGAGVCISHGYDNDSDGSDSHFPERVAGTHAYHLCVSEREAEKNRLREDHKRAGFQQDRCGDRVPGHQQIR